MLDFDSTRQPFRPQELAALIVAIENAHPSDEQDWLEWKSVLDLGSKAHLASIARCILALANRDPTTASEVVDGFGYMVVGVQPGEVAGVQARDNADLDRDLQRLLGQGGPRWRPQWVMYKDVAILIIEVLPPRPGDPIFVSQKDSGDLIEGTIYVRHRARSQPATAADIQMLSERLQAGGRTLRLSLRVQDGVGIRPLLDPTEPMQKHLLEIERELLASLPKPEPLARPGDIKPDLSAFFGFEKAVKASSLSGILEIQEESRTEDEFRAQVARHIEELEAGITRALDHVAGQSLSPLRLHLVNPTDSNFEEVRIEAHIEGDVRAIEPIRQSETVWDLLPDPPRKWGPYKKMPFSLGGGGNLLNYRPSYGPSGSGPTLNIQNGGSALLTFPPLHLRPRASERLDAFVCLAPVGSQSLGVTWKATATNVEGVAKGSFEIPVDGEPFDCWNALAKATE